MKKVLFLIFASLLVLGACGNNDSEKKEENKSTEHKKSNDPKKDNKKHKENKSIEESNQSTERNTNEQQFTEQTNQQSQQQNTTNQQSVQSNHEPTKEEVAEWDKQNVKGGTDYGLVDEDEVNNDGDTQPTGNSSNQPRSLREIKEETGKSPLDFTEEEKAEAQAYADAH